jgi:chromosome segregation ATPase
MATESADEPDMSVTLPPELERWLEDRADTLDVDREELVVQLLSAYRTTADLDGEEAPAIESPELDAEFLEDIERRIETVDEAELERLERRVGSLESELDEHVDDIRNRVLQLRDGLQDRAEEDHDHTEIDQLNQRVNGLADDIDGLGTDVANLSDSVEAVDEQLADVTAKLNRLARIIVALRKQSDDVDTKREQHLEDLKRRAGREEIRSAKCAGCSSSVDIALLTEPACPNCGIEFGNLTPSTSIFGSSKLTAEDPPAIESGEDTDG